MSADRYTVCPKCTIRKGAAELAIFNRLKAAYGVLSAKDYVALNARCDVEIAALKQDETTLREDFWIGVCDGVLKISYDCSCPCGFTFRYSHNQKIEDENNQNRKS